MMTLVRWISRRSLPLLHASGAAAGWLAYALSPSYRRRLIANAALAGVDATQRRASVGQAGRMAAELPWLWFGPAARPISRWVRWDGDAHLEAALAAGRGVVLLTPHLGSFEVCAQAYAERFGAAHPLTALYRPPRKARLRAMADAARARPGLHTAPTTLAGVRQMARALKAGDAVGLLPDQVPPAGLGVWAPFFGRPAYTMTLAARLVQRSGAALLVAWAERLPAARGWVVRVMPTSGALPVPAASADEEAAQVASATWVNREMERLVRQCPSQYLWGYHRYKRPRGDDRQASAAPAADVSASTPAAAPPPDAGR